MQELQTITLTQARKCVLHARLTLGTEQMPCTSCDKEGQLVSISGLTGHVLVHFTLVQPCTTSQRP